MRWRTLTFLAFGILLCGANLYAEKVRYVIDGDTFILENNQRVRMIGINAPEISHRRYGKKRGEYFGKQSKAYLKRLIEGRDVELKKGGEPFDRFGRRLAYVYLPDGTFVNAKMVEEGYAEVFRKFPFDHKEEFMTLEAEARSEWRGVWKKRSWTDNVSDFFSALLR